MEVHDIYRRQGSRLFPRKRNAKKSKWLSEKRTEVKKKKKTKEKTNQQHHKK